jgi:hypothetical protein
MFTALALMELPESAPAMPASLIAMQGNLIKAGLKALGHDIPAMFGEFMERYDAGFEPTTNQRTRKEIEDEIAEAEAMERASHRGSSHPGVDAPEAQEAALLRIEGS